MESAIRTALITSDGELRKALGSSLRPREGQLRVVLDLEIPFNKLGEDHLSELRRLDPELVFLDLEVDPVLGLKFAQFLSDLSPARRIIATGPMLGSQELLNALRAGIAEYLPKPVTAEAIGAAIDGVSRRMRWSPNAPAQPGQLLAVFSAKGGSGATTLATNLAIHLHRLTGRRTLLVDLDLELGEIALQLGVEPRFNLVDMVRNFHRMDTDLLASFIDHHSSGVHVLSAPYHPEKTEVVTGDQIARILHFLKQNYEYVIVDTSKSFSPATLATFDQADRIYLVTVADLPSLRNIARCLPMLRRVTGPTDDRIRLVVNRHQDDSVISLTDIESTLGLKAFGTIANDYETVMRSINSGSPVLLLDGQSRYAQCIKTLGAEIAGLRPDPEPERAPLIRRMVEPLRKVWSSA